MFFILAILNIELQAAAASAARIAQLECELVKKVVPASGDSEGLKKQLMEAEARVKMAEERAAEAALAATAAGKAAKEREKTAQDAAAKEVEHLKAELVSCYVIEYDYSDHKDKERGEGGGGGACFISLQQARHNQLPGAH